MFRIARFLVLLSVAAGLPYVVFNRDKFSSVSGLRSMLPVRAGYNDFSLTSFVPDPGLTGGVGGTSETLNADGTPAEAPLPPPQLAGPITADLREVVRLDVTPDWVVQRWSRVTTVLADINFLGLRVPLVTGSAVDDVAGALTYYFDKQHRVRRVTFHGTTGEETRLVKLMTDHYGFYREPHLGAGMYVVRWNGKPTSVLRVVHAPIVRASAPHAQLDVMLEINRPDLQYELSPEAQEILQADQASRKW